MENIETLNFSFLSFDSNNNKHQEIVSLMEDDPLINKYLGSMQKHFEITDFSDEISGHYLAFKNEDFVGFITIYDYQKYQGLDWAVIKDYRGVKLNNESVATLMIREITDEMFLRRRELEYFRAYIDRENIRSIKMAQKAGFVFSESHYPLLHDSYVKERENAIIK